MKATGFALNSVYAKIHCIYGQRLTKRNYEELLSLHSVGEIAEYLKNKTAYSEIFEGLDTTSQLQRGQLEGLLYNKLYNSLDSVIRFETAAGSSLYEYFIMRYDLTQLLNVMSSLKTRSDSYLFNMPVFYNERSKLDLYAMAKAKNEDELLKTAKGTVYYSLLKDALSIFHITNNLADVQARFASFLDEQFVNLTNGRKKRNEPGGKETAALYKTLRDVTFVRNVYRVKRFSSYSRSFDFSALVPGISALTRKQIDAIVNASDMQSFLQSVAGTYLSAALPKQDGRDFYHSADEYVYNRFSGTVSRSTDPHAALFAYVWLAENEIKNIIHIIEGVRYGMTAIEIFPMLCGVSVS